MVGNITYHNPSRMGLFLGEFWARVLPNHKFFINVGLDAWCPIVHQILCVRWFHVGAQLRAYMAPFVLMPGGVNVLRFDSTPELA